MLRGQIPLEKEHLYYKWGQSKLFCIKLIRYYPFLLSALENELLKEIEPPSSAQPRLQPLENILATMKFTPTTQLGGSQGNDKQQLCKEGSSVTDMLPDLNFMSAKVLMFPVKGTPDD